ncbi:dynein axonemal heavy chain 7-like [Euwallacea similis]|uniref:dynein axonemal heavy chain 7-like n=1 Tax=Euwallacea similis TaxID=1736056 RepID=UPI00344D4151
MASGCVVKEVKSDKILEASTVPKTYDYWNPSKRNLSDMNFLQTLKDFNKDHIKIEIINKFRKEFLPYKDFKPHVVAKASSAAECFYKWIIAMDVYDGVAKGVASLRILIQNPQGFILLDITKFLSQEKTPVTIDLGKVEVHSDAKMYLSGCESDAKCSEEICNKIAVINV